MVSSLIEVIIGSTLLFIAVIGAMALIPKPMQTQNLNDFAESAVLSIAENNDFKNSVLLAKDNNVESPRQILSALIAIPFSIKICDTNLDCIGENPSSQKNTTVSYLMEGNSTMYSPKIIRVSVWLQ